jgi:hypothetical protein
MQMRTGPDKPTPVVYEAVPRRPGGYLALMLSSPWLSLGFRPMINATLILGPQ